MNESLQKQEVISEFVEKYTELVSNHEKTNLKLNEASCLTESSSRKALNQSQMLESNENMSKPIPIKIIDKKGKVSKIEKNTPSSPKFLQKKKKNPSPENNADDKNAINVNNGKTKRNIFDIIKVKNGKIKEKNQNIIRGFQMVNVNNVNNTNNNFISPINNNDNNINRIKIDINEEELLHQTEEYKDNTIRYDPTKERRNFKKLNSLYLFSDIYDSSYYFFSK